MNLVAKNFTHRNYDDFISKSMNIYSIGSFLISD